MTALGIKPVRQCAGCALNLVSTCAIFHHPSLKWKDHRCEGYNNPMYIAHYERTLKPKGAPPKVAASRPAASRKAPTRSPAKSRPKRAVAKTAKKSSARRAARR